MSDNNETKAKFTLQLYEILAIIGVIFLLVFGLYWMGQNSELSSGRYKYAESLNKYPEMKPTFNEALKDGKITKSELDVIESKYKEVEKNHVKKRLNKTE